MVSCIHKILNLIKSRRQEVPTKSEFAKNTETPRQEGGRPRLGKNRKI